MVHLVYISMASKFFLCLRIRIDRALCGVYRTLRGNKRVSSKRNWAGIIVRKELRQRRRHGMKIGGAYDRENFIVFNTVVCIEIYTYIIHNIRVNSCCINRAIIMQKLYMITTPADSKKNCFLDVLFFCKIDLQVCNFSHVLIRICVSCLR